MSKELDARIDTLRNRLISTAGTPIGMGNYKAQMRAYQEMMLELINITDAVNAAGEHVSPGVMDTLKAAIKDMLARPAKAEGEK